MRSRSRNPRRETRWKWWLDRIAVAWIVCAPLGVLAAGWLGLRPGTPETGPRAEVPIQYLLPQGTEPSALPAGSARGEPWRTAAVRPRP
jgi:hypothetical protein